MIKHNNNWVSCTDHTKPKKQESVAMRSISGKLAVVSGASNGIGAAFCEALLSNGALVAMLDIDEESGEALERRLNARYGGSDMAIQSPLPAHFIKCDVTNVEQLTSAFDLAMEVFGRSSLDIVCNNAGVNEPADAVYGTALSDRRAWITLLNINLVAVIDGTRLALQRMDSERGGMIINTASMAGLIPIPMGPVYTASKHAVVGFTRSVAATSLSRFNVRTNCICPSFTDTKLVTDALKGASAVSSGFVHTVRAQGALLSPILIARGLIELLHEEKNGACMRVTQQSGIDYERFRKRGGGGAAAAAAIPFNSRL